MTHVLSEWRYHGRCSPNKAYAIIRNSSRPSPAFQLHTLGRLPDGTEVALDKGYQGVATQVELVTVRDTTGQEQHVPRLTVRMPHKKPRGGELTDAQHAANRAINTLRVRAEYCLGWAKNWAILEIHFRYAHDIYASIMQAICGLVNRQTHRWQAAKEAEAAYCA